MVARKDDSIVINNNDYQMQVVKRVFKPFIEETDENNLIVDKIKVVLHYRHSVSSPDLNEKLSLDFKHGLHIHR